MPRDPSASSPVLGHSVAPVRTGTAPVRRVDAALFAFALFVSAFLLFVLEPFVAKSMLPRLGGTPMVWNTCVVFFQAALLVGYFVAHLTTRPGLPRSVACARVVVDPQVKSLVIEKFLTQTGALVALRCFGVGSTFPTNCASARKLANR